MLLAPWGGNGTAGLGHPPRRNALEGGQADTQPQGVDDALSIKEAGGGLRPVLRNRPLQSRKIKRAEEVLPGAWRRGLARFPASPS